MPEIVFFLGGHDLEMLTIRTLLDEHHIRYVDKRLSWENASLAEYAEELRCYAKDGEVTVYGVELHEKGVTDIPDNYRRVDHHNDYSYLPSALEQTADILGVQLNREQQLIAANDSGYIPAMQALGAGKEEIEYIRLLDRRAQGVTEADELEAEEAIQNKMLRDGIIIVKSGISRFSPITDRLYPYERLLVYTDDELMYYGKGKGCLVSYFKDEITAGRMFHGGGDTGFIGTVKRVFSKEAIIDLKDKIISMIPPDI